MALTEAQKTTLAAYIEADPDLDEHPNNIDGAIAIASRLNAPADPVFWVFRSRYSLRVFLENGVDWVEIGGLNQQRERILDNMKWLGEVDTRKTNVRDGFSRMLDASPNTMTRYLELRRRPATRVEQLLADGPGTESEPAVTTFEGAISFMEIYNVRNLG